MSYANNNYFKSGAWNVICDVCGVRFKSDEVRKRWDGLIVCHEDWEADHPQKFLRVQADGKQVPFIRTEPEDTFITTTCDYWNSSPIADFGTADCAYVGGNISVERLIELFYPQTSCVADIAITSRAIVGVI